jgi:hypothetical protein
MVNSKKFTNIVSALCFLSVSLGAQVNLPKQREDVIATAEAFLKTREASIPDDQDALDPFLGKIKVSSAVSDQSQDVAARVAEADSADLIRRIALSINASGTAILGENRFLLTGRHRHRVGSSFVVKYNGVDYEVILSEVTSTTFTIKRNNQTHTRAVKL